MKTCLGDLDHASGDCQQRYQDINPRTKPLGQKLLKKFLGTFKHDRAFSLLHQELPQILVLCFP